jgi:hypothetical protein
VNHKTTARVTFVVFCTTLLSPLLTLQETHSLCLVSGLRASGPKTSSGCCSYCEVENQVAHRSKHDSVSRAVTTGSQEQSLPCDCPVGCVCRRPAVPQNVPTRTVLTEALTQYAAIVSMKSEYDMGQRPRSSSPKQFLAAVLSAPEFCALRCRFTC